MQPQLLSRVKQFQKTLTANRLNGFLVSKKENIQYFTGIKGLHPTNRESFFLITPSTSLLYHSSFIEIPPSFPFRAQAMNPQHPLETVVAEFYQDNHESVGIEAQNLTVAEFSRLKNILPGTKIIPTQNMIENQRIFKDRSELSQMRQAGQITAKTMRWITEHLKKRPSLKITEIEVVRLIENKLFNLGASGLAFPVIVAFDANAAQPHHLPDSTRITHKSVILIDMGCQYQGYAADMTRTICLSPTPPSEFRQVESLVKKAYYHAVKAATKKDALAKNIDAAARELISKAGYGPNFIHTTGHGLGLEIHEQPSINSQNDFELKNSMAFTIEPGIYLKDKFGYRYENTLVKMNDQVMATTQVS